MSGKKRGGGFGGRIVEKIREREVRKSDRLRRIDENERMGRMTKMRGWVARAGEVGL